MKHMRFENILRTTLVLAMAASVGVAAAAGKKKKTVKKVVPAKVVKVNPALKPLFGAWTLHTSHDKEDKSIRITFNQDGTFVWKGSGWMSKGTFGLKDQLLTLNWTAVDDMKVKPGTMKKSLPLSDGLLSFKIEKFTYARLGAKLPAPQPIIETPATLAPIGA